jgi:hypothetical protein
LSKYLFYFRLYIKNDQKTPSFSKAWDEWFSY